MVKANVEILSDNLGKTDIAITGSSNEVILETSLILMRIKAKDSELYEDIFNSMEIINNSLEDGIDVDDLQDMFIKAYIKALKESGKL